MAWIARRKRVCLHHNPNTGESYVSTFLVNLGREKHAACRACGQYWTRWS